MKIYHYDPDYRPDHEVLEKIRLLSSSGLLVPVIKHGQLETPNLPGKKNDYQLMAFCEGGSLEDVVMAIDESSDIYAVVDTNMNVLVKFRFMDYFFLGLNEELKSMKEEAIRKLSERE